jgi:hypothetical protein
VAWLVSVLAGVACYAVAVALIQVSLARSWQPGSLYAAMALLTVAAAAFVPRGWGVPFGVMAGTLVLFVFIGGDLLTRMPAACDQPEVACEGPSGGSFSILMAAWLILAGLVGAMAQAAYRAGRRAPPPG